jgi:hypothetical protein
LLKLHAIAPYTEQWFDGPHLSGLRSLTLEDYDQVVLHGALNSPHLVNLEELIFRVPDYGEAEHAAFAGELEQALRLPRARQLKRLSLPLWTDRAAEVLADAENLTGLEALEFDLYPRSIFNDHFDGIGIRDPDDDIRRIPVLARSPYLSALCEFRIIGSLSSDAVVAIVRNPAWRGLRKLDLQMALPDNELDILTGNDDLPDLKELRLSRVSFSVAQIAALRHSPLLKRLRHFAVRGYDSMDFEIADAVDPNRIETFAIGKRETPPRVVAMLRDRFGDRLRLLD